MFDYSSIPNINTLSIKFDKVSDTESNMLVDDAIVGTISKDPDGNLTYTTTEVKDLYNNWIHRPERRVGQLVNIENKSLDQLMTMYEELLIGAYLKKFPDTEVNVETAPYVKMIDWLRSTDFYRAPASTQYHESIVGGLLIHSLKVYNEAIVLNRLPKFRTVSVASVAFCALVHDWCKINTYESFKRNVKNEQTGQWEQVDSFRRNMTGLTLGHGVTSMFNVMQFAALSEDEAAAIRWHQGRWNVCEPEINEFQRCNEIYPLVHLIQFADQLAIVQY